MPKDNFHKKKRRARRLQCAIIYSRRERGNDTVYCRKLNKRKFNYLQKPSPIGTQSTRKFPSRRILMKQDKHFKKDHKE